MEKSQTKSTLKLLKNSSYSGVSCNSMVRGMAYQKPPTKENTRPQEIKLHTEQRAIKRAMFNYSVATKMYFIELQRKHEEKLQKMIEEEEIRLLRKEMIPRAQLMPYFDRPFFPQRSNRRLTIPREPSFHMMSSKCWGSISNCEPYKFQQRQVLNPIK